MNIRNKSYDISKSDCADDKAVSGDVELSCGYGKCRPSCLRRAASAKTLLASLCCFVFVQGFLVNGINNVNTSTLERRFDLSSSKVAWVSSAYDLSAAVVCITLGYIAMFAHKGRLLAITAGVMATGGFIMFLPHLLVGKYELGVKITEFCNLYDNVTVCSEEATDSSAYLYVLICGMALIGVGGSCVYIVGTTWIDENINIQNTPLYLGIMHTFAALGPAVAFVCGGTLLDIYVDVGRMDPDELDIGPSDPRWVGAWWIGYLISAFGALLVGFIMACFPRTLHDAELQKDSRVSQSYKGQGDLEMSDPGFGRSWKDIGTSLRVVFTNPVWIFITLAGIMESGAIMAFNTFLPKMLQFQFGMTASMSAIVSGAVVVPGAAIGQIFGGLIPRWGKFRVRGLLLQCAVCSVIGATFAACLLIRCDMPKIAGVTTSYPSTNTTDTFSLESACNAECSCNSKSYEPVCSTAGIEYFSPCHAGCISNMDEDKPYTDCTCIQDNNHVTNVSQAEADDGICHADCNKLYIFMPLFFVIILATFIANTAGHSIVMRIVADRSRSFAYGLQSAIVRLLGNVPGPIIIGSIFDYSCLVWQDNCGSRGSCWIYDNAALSWRLFMVCLIVNVTSGFLFFLSVAVYRPPKATQDAHSVDGTASSDDTKHDTITLDDAIGYSNNIEHEADKVPGTMDTNNTIYCAGTVDTRDTSNSVKHGSEADDGTALSNSVKHGSKVVDGMVHSNGVKLGTDAVDRLSHSNSATHNAAVNHIDSVTVAPDGTGLNDTCPRDHLSDGSANQGTVSDNGVDLKSPLI